MSANSSRPVAIVLLGLVVVASLLPLFLLADARRANGEFGFPLDDPWIHLNYARNLQEHGQFSYFPGDPSSAGSTSPLYTILLALGLSIVGDEKLLSYAIGLLFHLGFLWATFAWARQRLQHRGLAAAVVIALALDPRVALLAVSGMETSLFLCLIALAFAAWAGGRRLRAGILCGLAVFARPEALILGGVFLVDALWEHLRGAGERRAFARFLLPFAALLLLYGGLNYAVAGSPWPNTIAAKAAYYGTKSRASFLRSDLLGLFRPGIGLLVLPLCALVVLGELRALWSRRPGLLRAEAGWILGLSLALLVALPYSHRFARYLVPLLPAALICATQGLRWLLPRLFRATPQRARLGLGALAAVLLLAVQARAGLGAAAEYRELCDYHFRRHERVGHWLAANTPRDAVVATHDVGAIAYHSRRRVVDLVGLIQSDMVQHLNRSEYVDELTQFLQRERVTHLAVLRNWLEVANVDPLFLADPEPELLEVYAWIPGRTHLVSGAVTRLNLSAVNELQANRPAAARTLMEESLRLDAANSRSYYVAGLSHAMLDQDEQAIAAYRRALELHPGNREVTLQVAPLLAARGAAELATQLLRVALERHPADPQLRQLLSRLQAAPAGG